MCPSEYTTFKPGWRLSLDEKAGSTIEWAIV